MCIAIICMLVIFTACNKSDSLPRLSPQKYSSEKEYHEALLAKFVKANLLDQYGIHTNYIDNEQAAEVATGHEVLSESSGLLLRYFATKQQKKDFDALWKQTQDTFNNETGFSYRYSPLYEKKYMINVAVDDLRIIRSLFEAYESFSSSHYQEQALQYGQRFLDYNVIDNKMYNYYDEDFQLTNQFISLSYIDLKTISLLAEHLNRSELYNNMLKISKTGYISDEFPFYHTHYFYDTNEYQSDTINTVESLMTILFLAEVGEQNDKSIAYIKQKLNNEELVGQYDIDGTALNNVHSTAVYALSAMIGSQVGDKELYNKSITLMEQQFILDEEHEMFGSYANKETLQLYSYDNLLALLAYNYE